MTTTWVDRLTDRLARRPSGRIGRALYRHAAGHQAGFQFVLDQVKVGPGDRVLDVGCGGGAFLAHALARGIAAAAGVDHSADMRATTAQENAAAVAEGRLEILAGDAAALPLASGAFSHVFCCNAFFFFPDPAGAIAEMARVAVPGGHVAILTTPPSMEKTARWVFGPLARRMRFDDAATLAGWSAAAGLVTRAALQAPGGGLLHVARKPEGRAHHDADDRRA